MMPRPAPSRLMVPILAASAILAVVGLLAWATLAGGNSPSSPTAPPIAGLPGAAAGPGDGGQATPAPLGSLPDDGAIGPGASGPPSEPTGVPGVGSPTAGSGDGSGSTSPPLYVPRPTPTPAPTPTPTPHPTPTPPPVQPASGPSDQLRMHLVTRITGGLTPKSVVATQTGLFFVQNMIYLHNVRVYNRQFQVVKTISDKVTLSDYGYTQYPHPVRGGPVEAAVTPDKSSVYVSNYAMFGPGFTHQGNDNCRPGQTIDRSFVYRIDLATLRKTGVTEVGSTPKYLAVTPDGSTLLVSNWCSGNVSIVNLGTFRETARIKVGWHPRGIAFDAASKTAYIAVWDLNAIAKINLRTHAVSYIRNVGLNPRHLVIDPKGRYLYVSLDGAGQIAKLDLRTEHVVARVHTGNEPRSMAIAADGRSLYVVNYSSATVSKVRTSDMHVIQVVNTDHHPIGVTYDAATREVWISCYSGTLRVYRDQ